MQTLIGQVFNFKADTFKKTVEGKKEDKHYCTFRLGMQKPYKVQKVIDGKTREVRESAFITAKCFNGLSETLEEYFGGEENKGRWILIHGHYETNSYDRKVTVDHPENPNAELEFEVPTPTIEFIINNFSFIGDAPERKEKPASSTGPKVKVKTKTQTSATASEAEKAALNQEISDEDAPF